MDKEIGRELKHQGMNEIAHGHIGKGIKDLMIGQAQIKKGKEEIKQGKHDKRHGNHQMHKGMN